MSNKKVYIAIYDIKLQKAIIQQFNVWRALTLDMDFNRKIVAFVESIINGVKVFGIYVGEDTSDGDIYTSRIIEFFYKRR